MPLIDDGLFRGWDCRYVQLIRQCPQCGDRVIWESGMKTDDEHHEDLARDVRRRGSPRRFPDTAACDGCGVELGAAQYLWTFEPEPEESPCPSK